MKLNQLYSKILIVNWQYFPKSEKIPQHLFQVISAFEKNYKHIDSKYHKLPSNKVLEVLRLDLENLGYAIERSKKHVDRIKVPVLFGKNRSAVC